RHLEQRRPGERRLGTVSANDLDFSYRTSNLDAGDIVIDVVMQGQEGAPADIEARMQTISTQRMQSQPVRLRTGGSTFKNPPGDKSAWALIDAVGGRGLRIGGAMVSEKHCNFLINTDGCSAADLFALGSLLRQRVFDEFGITLEWEIHTLGFDGHS
ncbi:MAG: UDP-N-acetylenolpyruvoylglucosamine reductase, partial [Pseudomonadota bacterium]